MRREKRRDGDSGHGTSRSGVAHSRRQGANGAASRLYALCSLASCAGLPKMRWKERASKLRKTMPAESLRRVTGPRSNIASCPSMQWPSVSCKITAVASSEPYLRVCLALREVRSPVRPRVSFPLSFPSLRVHRARRRERDRRKSTCSLMDRAGASSESQDAHCPPPPPPPHPHPRPTTSSHQSSAPVASSVVSPSTQARQAFKFAAPAAAVRGAAPPVLATKRPTSLPTTGTSSVTARSETGTPSLTTSRLRQFQSSAATDPSRALPRAWAPAAVKVTATAPVVPGDLDTDDADDVDEVLLAGQTLDLVKQFDAAQRQLAAPLSTKQDLKNGHPLQEEAVATDSRGKAPKGDLDPLRRDRTSHKSQPQASSRGPRSFHTTRSSDLRGETRSSSSAAIGTSEDTSNAMTDSRKRTSPQETADAPVQKRQRDGIGEKGDDSTKKPSREVTPRTDPPASEIEGQKTNKKSTASRPSTTDRFKRSSGSRSSKSRSRPATSAAFFDETMANLRRWQRHEGELVGFDLFTDPMATRAALLTPLCDSAAGRRNTPSQD